MGASAGARVVPGPVREPDGTAGAGLAAHPGAPCHADRRTYGLGQDPGRLSCLHRPPGPAGAGGRPPGPHRGALRFAVEGAGQRHPEKPGSAAGRDSAACGRARAADAGNPHRGAHRGHADAGAPRHAEAPAAHPGDHAGIALPAAHGGKKPAHPARGGHGDCGRNPRRCRRQARLAPGALAGAAGLADRRRRAAAAGEDWTERDAETD